jgi:hypothetical protein
MSSDNKARKWLATTSNNFKILFSTEQGLVALVLTPDQIKWPDQVLKLLMGTKIISFAKYCKSLALNIAALPIRLPLGFIQGLISEVALIVQNEENPCTKLKDLFFQAQRVSCNTHYPQSAKWIRYHLYRKGVHGHGKRQKVHNLPPSPLQYYLLEMSILCREHTCSLFRPMELITQPIGYEYSSIVSESTADQDMIDWVCMHIPTFLKRFSPKTKTPDGTHFYMSYQKGPNGKQSIRELYEDLTALRGDPSLHNAVLGLITKTNSSMGSHLASIVTEQDNECKFNHSKLVFLEDGKFGKTRIVALGDMVSQSALTGIDKVLMDILRSNKINDVTFNQAALPQYMKYHSYKYGALPATSDLTAFTDRLPRRLNQTLVESLFGKEIGELWGKVVFERRFTTSKDAVNNGVPSHVSYAVGSPMGLLTSWSSSAIVHHLIIDYAHWLCGVNELRYIVLGDDVGIWNRQVYETYIELMMMLGVEVNRSKSTNSPKYCEFAKRLFVLERDSKSKMSYIEEVTGLPGSASAQLQSGSVSGLSGFLSQLAGRLSISLLTGGRMDYSPPIPGCACALALVQVLLYLYEVNNSSYWRSVTYISSWVFDSRCSLLQLTLKLPGHLIPMGSDLLTNTHGVPINLAYASLVDFLKLQDIAYRKKSDRLAIYQLLNFRNMKDIMDTSTRFLSFLAEGEDDPNIQMIFAEHLLVLAASLTSKVLAFLFSDTDMMSDEAVKSLNDYQTVDLLNRLEQVCKAQKIRRREISIERDSKLGRDLITLLNVEKYEVAIETWRYTDVFQSYSEQSSAIDDYVSRLDLGKTQKAYLHDVLKKSSSNE